MKKIIKIGIVAVIASVGLSANAQVISDKTKNELKGIVSSCTTRVYKAVDRFGEIQKGSLESEKTVTYDKKGFLLSDSKYHYENTYTQAGKISVIDAYFNPISTTGANVTPKLSKRRKFTYQTSKVIESVYGRNGSKDGDIIWTKNQSVDNASSDTETITYNAAGNPVKQKNEYGGLVAYSTYTYNAKGALQTLSMTISAIGGGANRKISYTKYKYDAKGNWTYRVKSQDGDVIDVEEREITY